MKSYFHKEMMVCLLLSAVYVMRSSMFAQSATPPDALQENPEDPSAAKIAEKISLKNIEKHYHNAIEFLAISKPSEALSSLEMARAAKKQAASHKTTAIMTPEEKIAYEKSQMADTFRYQAIEQLANESLARFQKNIELSTTETLAANLPPELRGPHLARAEQLKAELATSSISGMALGHLENAKKLTSQAKATVDPEETDAKSIALKTEASKLSFMADTDYHEALEHLARSETKLAEGKIAKAKSLQLKSEKLQEKATKRNAKRKKVSR